MKTLFLILGTVLSTITMNSQEISLENDKINYGEIQYGDDGHRDFVITNIGTEPLLINNVVGQCGCTTAFENGKPGWPTEPIRPNGKGIIKINYDTKRVGKFNKMITISSNDLKGEKKIFIYGNVLPKKD